MSIKFCLISIILVMLPLIGNSNDTKPVDSQITFSIDYADKDVREVLRAIADTFEVNVLIPDALNGRTSIKLSDVTWEQAYRIILEPMDWGYETDGQIIRVKPNNPQSIVKDSDPSEMLSFVGAMQTSMAKSLLRDKDFAEAMAEFYWNFYSALLSKGFSKEEAIRIVVATGEFGSVSQ